MPQLSDNIVNLILDKLSQINDRLDTIEVRLDNLTSRLSNLEDNFSKFRGLIKSDIAKGDNTIEIRKLSSKIDEMKEKMRPFTSYGSQIIELGINNAVRDYYNSKTLSGNITNIKADVIRKLNKATGLDARDCLIFHPNTSKFEYNKVFTEFDGVFNFSFANERHLIIVESKMIFTLAHLIQKYALFLEFKKFVLPDTTFADQNYHDAFMECFGDYKTITIVYGALHWEIQLDALYYDDDRIVYDPDNEIYDPADFLTNEPTMALNYRADDNYHPKHLHPEVSKMTDLPDVKFVVSTYSGFQVYKDYQSMLGGSDSSIDDNSTSIDNSSTLEE